MDQRTKSVPETIKLLEGNIVSTLQDRGMGKEYLKYTQKDRKSKPN